MGLVGDRQRLLWALSDAAQADAQLDSDEVGTCPTDQAYLIISRHIGVTFFTRHWHNCTQKLIRDKWKLEQLVARYFFG